MKPTIKIFENTNELSVFFAEFIIEKLKEKKEMLSIALSGGSTPKALFEFLATNYKDKIDWRKIQLFWGDERCVEPESDESNYKMTRQFLINHISIPEENIFRIKGENDPEVECVRYSELVKNKLKAESGIPVFDIVLLGLGEDGHTASIFPDRLDIFNSEKLFEVATNPYSGQIRISATGKLINHASNVIFMVTGKSKAPIVSNVISQKNNFEKLPASFVKPLNNNLLWLLDKNAASEL